MTADRPLSARAKEEGGNIFFSEPADSVCCEAAYTSEEEELAAEWIQRTTHTPFRPEPCQTFAKNVKDGVVLCNVMNAIKPGAIGVVHTIPLGYKQQENLRAFLKAAEAVGVPKEDLFQTADAFEMKDTLAVVRCVLKLAAVAANTLPEYSGPELDELNTSNSPVFRNTGSSIFSSSSACIDSLPISPCSAEGGPTLAIDLDAIGGHPHEAPVMNPPQQMSQRARQLCPKEVVLSPRALVANSDPVGHPARTPKRRTHPQSKRWENH